MSSRQIRETFRCVCIGWPTIYRLARGEMVDVGGVSLIAADGLHGYDFQGERSRLLAIADEIDEADKFPGPGGWADRIRRAIHEPDDDPEPIAEADAAEAFAQACERQKREREGL